MPAAQPELSTQRIEAFSDGVFAIAITLLILEIKAPAPTGQNGGLILLKALLQLWPSYFTYVLSFVMIGIYWANHHYLFKLFKGTNHTFNLLNILFLMCISFLPLPTLVLGQWVVDPDNRVTAVTFYAIGLTLPAAAWFLLWLYACRNKHIIDQRLDPAFLRRMTRQYLASIALYLCAVAVSPLSANLGLAICVGLTFLYLSPPRRPVYLQEKAITE